MNRTLLIIGYVWPEPNTTAAGGRMLQLIQFFLEQGYQITLASTAFESEHSLDLEQLGVRKKAIRLNHSSFDAFIMELNPAIVLFDRFMTEEQFGWRVVKTLPNAIRILDTEDLHSLRKARQEAYSKGIPFEEKEWLGLELTKREMASIYRSDISLIISLFEMELLEKILSIPDHIVLHLPMMFKTLGLGEDNPWLDYDEKTDFICIGNGKHAPNIDAIRQLKKEIWPLIFKELPNSILRIYGAYLPEGINQMHEPRAGFYIMGHAKSSKDVISKARINLAPLNFGAGIKGKLLEGMRYGTPSITTDIGAEGISTGLPWNGRIANDSPSFAKAAVALYQNRVEWQQAQRNGATIIDTFYNKDLLQIRFLQKIGKVRSALKEHRTKNFVGSMLLHHTLTSTKYMSKWIEEKNKRLE